ncbi:MD-2-related lipid-recognition protein-like [Athalia rosae]|uniref:MD-2-related lipid-recognition protein-like n=1 Tax=Athalia rosae TaxID=37344 RepID=UPI002033C8CD|nr:MD-2-related lipid-recognition protein-like [Athalia rosae]
MKNFRSFDRVLIALFAVAAISTTLAEVVVWQPCSDEVSVSEQPGCTIHEVRVNPCREAAQGKPCRIKRGRNAGITFDYTPNFSSDTLQNRAYWTRPGGDLPFIGMNLNACNATVCPSVSGQKQTYSYQLSISQSFPARTYDVKWKLWNQEQQECCFVFQIKLYK